MNTDPASRAEVLSPSEQYVRDQWHGVVVPNVAEELLPAAEEVLNRTINAYNEPHRRYHTLDHIADCLAKLHPYTEREDYLQLFLGLLWHDVVYDTNPRQQGEASSEELSADFASQAMHVLGLERPGMVYEFIRATENYQPKNEAEALLCDIDMSILAAARTVYDTYVRDIRFEYGQYSDEQFNAGRLMMLKSFSQPFHHPDFVHLNEAAYVNIDREAESLSRQPS